jgi:hypothetical protein
MTDQDAFVRRLTDIFEDIGIDYMISGSIGSSFHVKPRATNDADIVIDPTTDQLARLVELLADDYYVSSKAIFDALRLKTMFNIIDIKDGWKADIIIRKDKPFSRKEFERRLKATFLGAELWVLSAEDAILSKLQWAQQAQSQRQFEDALGVAVVQWHKLDIDYLRKWASDLQIVTPLEELLKRAKKAVNQEKQASDGEPQ